MKVKEHLDRVELSLRNQRKMHQATGNPDQAAKYLESICIIMEQKERIGQTYYLYNSNISIYDEVTGYTLVTAGDYDSCIDTRDHLCFKFGEDPETDFIIRNSPWEEMR